MIKRHPLNISRNPYFGTKFNGMSYFRKNTILCRPTNYLLLLSIDTEPLLGTVSYQRKGKYYEMFLEYSVFTM